MSITNGGWRNEGTPRSKFEIMARQYLSDLELERFYERSGIFEHDAGMDPVKADETAYRLIYKGGTL